MPGCTFRRPNSWSSRCVNSLKSLYRDLRAIIHISSSAYLACDLLVVTQVILDELSLEGVSASKIGYPLRRMSASSGVGQAQNISRVIGII